MMMSYLRAVFHGRPTDELEPYLDTVTCIESLARIDGLAYAILAKRGFVEEFTLTLCAAIERMTAQPRWTDFRPFAVKAKVIAPRIVEAVSDGVPRSVETVLDTDLSNPEDHYPAMNAMLIISQAFVFTVAASCDISTDDLLEMMTRVLAVAKAD